ncbi:MAG TPA: type IV pilus secretin family protein [Candidatus Latescibacteria bacterium]|nr:type IV pilus secretin family protein [Candidatus Latescibacterota bacterium]
MPLRGTRELVIISMVIISLYSIVNAQGIVVRDIKTLPEDKGLSLEVSTTGKAEYKLFTLADPPRLVMDLYDAVYGVDTALIPVRKPPVSRVRSSQFRLTPRKIVRVVVDLNGPSPYAVRQEGGKIVLTFNEKVEGIGSKEAEVDTLQVALKPASGGSAPRSSSRQAASEGEPITLNLRGATLESALEALAKKSELNFLLSPELARKRITLHLSAVSIQDALRALLQANGLWYEQPEGTDIYIIKAAPGGPPVLIATEIVRCRYASAAELGDVVRQNLSANGKLTIDERSNSIILNDTPSNIARLKKIIEGLDQPTGQVLIEAQIVEVDLVAASEAGVSWEWTSKEGEGSLLGPSTLSGSFNKAGAEGVLSLFLGKYASDTGINDLKSFLTVLEKEGAARLLASPRVLSVENKPATIKITEHIALAKRVSVQAIAGGGVTVSEPIFGDVGVTLTVIPKINDNKFVLLDIKPTVSSAQKSAFFPNDAVDTKERSAETSVLVRDGQTVAIGGLLRDDVTESVAKVPLVGDIPVLGYLFKRKVKDSKRTEIVVFLTPHIVTPEDLEKITEQERWRFRRER